MSEARLAQAYPELVAQWRAAGLLHEADSNAPAALPS